MSTLRMLSLCSGIGGIDYAWSHLLGQEIAGQVEIDPFCQKVLAKIWSDVKRLADIREVQGDEFGPVDIIAGGIPCQPFSCAGKRRGTEDDRHLWPYAFAIIKAARPTWVLIENVDDFIDMALELVASEMEGENYEVGAYVLPACATGAPHYRQRAFIVAHTSGKQSQRRRNAGKLANQAGASQSREEEWQWLWNASRNGCEDVAYSDFRQCERRAQSEARWEQIPGGRDVRPDADRCGETLAYPESRERNGSSDTWSGRDGLADSSTPLANAMPSGRQECEPAAITAGTGYPAWRRTAPGIRLVESSTSRRWQIGESAARSCNQSDTPGRGISESGVGGMFDGLSSWLDRHQWPALPGCEQYAWEPPRTITGKQPYRNQRLKALGNAVVPQQIYPILAGIVEIESGHTK